jgi:ABC-type branched-subunit amino acid transport system substrate-binding protein
MGMSSNRVIHQASCALALVVSGIAGCNNIVGLDKISVTDDPSLPSGGQGGDGNGNGGTHAAAGSDSGGDTTIATSGTGGKANAHAGAGGAASGGDTMAMAGEGGTEPGDCTTNQECTDRAAVDAMSLAGAAAQAAAKPSVCVKTPIPHCAPLLSDDCTTITGNYLDNSAIIIGSLFSTTGTTAPTNMPRQQSATMAVEQVNSAGGIPSGSTSANGRPLVMVSCDEATNLVRAATHLVNDLHVPAIVGPNTSQDTLDVSTKVTVPGNTVVMSPTGVASSIASLSDNDLTWLMVPSDVQRAPLMISQINALEQALKTGPKMKTNVKLGVVFRNDALGIGTRTSLNDLMINGASMTATINLNNSVQIDGYNSTDVNETPLVTKYVTFAPDIIVLAGTAEAITKVMVPLEAAWTAPDRPNYVLIDSVKVPELLAALTNNPNYDDLRRRIRGTGITPGPSGSNTPGDTFNAFVLDYNLRYPGSAATTSGMGPAHDAAYAIALALTATRTLPVSGTSVAQGLRKLAGGAMQVEATSTNILAAFQKLAAGSNITAIGTFGNLDWDANGAVLGGTLEMWCVGGPTTKPAYASSGLMFDVKTQTKSGAYVQCGP